MATAATRVDVYTAQMGVEKDKLMMMTCGEGGSEYRQTQVVFREIWPWSWREKASICGRGLGVEVFW